MSLFVDTFTTVVTSSLITGIVTATLTQLLIRRAAKKAPKTTERAKVYEALVVHLWQRTDGAQYRRLECDEPELRAILAKLALYGESNVINAIAEFFASHSSATSGAQAHSVTQIVREMRKSILTGTGSEVLNCQVPDDWLLHNRRPLLLGREVLKAVMAAFTPGSQTA
jgi:hypothetical protein